MLGNISQSCQPFNIRKILDSTLSAASCISNAKCVSGWRYHFDGIDQRIF